MKSQSKLRYSWIFLYWMPYYNDLSRLGNDIMSILAESIQTDNITKQEATDASHYLELLPGLSIYFP